jgi:inner membrane protein
MERKGHYGVTLLLGAGAVLWLGLLYGLIATAVMLPVTSLPDELDQIVETWEHRGWTHSFAFALLVAFMVASSGAFPVYLAQQAATEYRALSSDLVVSPFRVWLFVGGFVTASLSGHVITDTLTVGGGFKVKPFWPISERIVCFGFCNSGNALWNGALLGMGIVAIVGAVAHEVYYLLSPSLGF